MTDSYRERITTQRRQAYPFGSDSECDDESPPSGTVDEAAGLVPDETVNSVAKTNAEKTSGKSVRFTKVSTATKRALAFGLPGSSNESPMSFIERSYSPKRSNQKKAEPTGSNTPGPGSKMGTGSPGRITKSPESVVVDFGPSGTPKYNSPGMDNPTYHTMEAESPSVEENDMVTPYRGKLFGTSTYTPKQINKCDLDFPEPRVPEVTGQLPCSIFFINKDEMLQRFGTFDELSEYLVNAALHESEDSNDVKQRFTKLLELPLKTANHYTTIGSYLKFLYETNRLTDVIIDVKGTKFGAHRIALSCQSDYFAKLFSDNNRSKFPIELIVNGISAASFAAFLEFCYTGEVKMTPEIASDMLIMADYLKAPALLAQCEPLVRKVPLEHALMMVIKNKTRSGDLFRSMFNMLLTRFTKASQINMFLSMDLELFCMFLRSDAMVVSTEYDVFTIAVRWILHDSDERLKFTIRIMKLIRFCYMSNVDLVRCVETTTLIRGYDKFRELVLIASWIRMCESLKRDDPFHFPKPGPRCYTGQGHEQTNVDVAVVMPSPLMTSTPRSKMMSPVETLLSKTVDILVVGGFEADSVEDNTKFVELYNTADNQWVHFCKLPAPRQHHAVATLGGQLYVIGGHDPTSTGKRKIPTRTVFRMNMYTKEWDTVASMNDARYRHCACAKDDKIYVIGGKGDADCSLRSIECYDEQTEGWYYLISMNLPRFGATAACIGDRIFVTGGIGESQDVPSTLHVLRSVVCYDIRTKSWTTMNDLRIPRCLANLVVVNERVFICGGATRSYNYKNSVLSSVTSLDEYDKVNDRWNHVTDLLVPRHDMGVAVAGDRVYIIGGFSTVGDRSLQTVECYDTKSGSWVPDVPDLPYPAKWICCTVVAPRDKHLSLDCVN